MDTIELEQAYRALFAVCDRGAADGFRPPADVAGWTAEHILAHIVAADRLLLAITAATLDGASQRPAYDDATTTVRPALDVLARAAGGIEDLAATVRQTARELVLLVRRVADDGARRPVQVRLVGCTSGEVGAARGVPGVRGLDGAVPWSGLLATHAQVHLPDHTAELASLCRCPQLQV